MILPAFQVCTHPPPSVLLATNVFTSSPPPPPSTLDTFPQKQREMNASSFANPAKHPSEKSNDRSMMSAQLKKGGDKWTQSASEEGGEMGEIRRRRGGWVLPPVLAFAPRPRSQFKHEGGGFPAYKKSGIHRLVRTLCCLFTKGVL